MSVSQHRRSVAGIVPTAGRRLFLGAMVLTMPLTFPAATGWKGDESDSHPGGQPSFFVVNGVNQTVNLAGKLPPPAPFFMVAPCNHPATSPVALAFRPCVFRSAAVKTSNDTSFLRQRACVCPCRKAATTPPPPPVPPKRKRPEFPPASCFDRASNTIASLPSAYQQKAPAL